MSPPLFQKLIDKSESDFENDISFFAAAAVLTIFESGSLAQPLPDCYHRLDELYQSIFELDANDSLNRVHIDSIGHSRGDQLGRQYPIYAVKISDNADTFEDEPVMLVICHIHAEEMIGIELCLNYMQWLVEGHNMTLLNATQIYFVPTMNPDGLQVISYGVPMGNDTIWDNTFRKNGYHPPQLASDCNISVGMGGEFCGVDLNRNFELNWVFGDTLWRPTTAQLYDYYRGPGPFSEPEDRAIRDFALQIKPALSIVYHSSRGDGHSVSIAEQGIVAWTWGYDPGPYKFAPDCTAIGRLDRIYCSLLHKETGGGTYDVVMGGTHNGCLQDWFYWRLGCMQILTELGPPYNIQPECNYLETLINEDQNSLNWLHRRLVNLPVNGDMNEAAVLKIYTKDANNPSQAISAEWRNANTWTSVLGPWTTNELYGRATFFPPQGPITILARKEGYADTSASTSINPAGVQTITLYLRPLPWYTMTFQIKDQSGAGVPGRVYLDCEFPKWITVPSGGQIVNMPEGEYRATIIPDNAGLMVMWRDFQLGGDGTLDVWCPAAQEAMSENFESGFGGWTSGGDGNNWHLEADTTMFMNGTSLNSNPTTGPFWPYVYPNNANTWTKRIAGINVPSGNIAMLQFDRRVRLDVPTDSLFVEISLDQQNWVKAARYCEMDVPWTRTYVNLSAWMPSTFWLRFRLVSDNAVGELGAFIDNVKVSYASDTAAPEPPDGLPVTYRITSAYPNPFNPSTTIRYETAGAGKAEWNIYNITGQLVNHETVEISSAGRYSFTWNGGNKQGNSVPTGLYLVQMRMNGHVSTQKVLLLR